MALFGSMVVVLWILAVGCAEGSSVSRDLRATDSVRHLRANETVHASGSDFVFSWAKCVICDGYDARLYLQDSSGTRMIPHQLKAAVTSLKITNVPPRTVYRFVVRRSASDAYGSEISGRSVSQEAPLPVENLKAEALSNSSIQIEWKSQSADGFVVRVLERKNLIQERVIPDFSNHSIMNISNLKPEIEYQVQVVAYYFPPAKNSTSPISYINVKTLPIVLPRLHLTWEFNSQLRLSWENPQSPKPKGHGLSCTGKSLTLIDARFSGDTDLVTLANVSNSREIDCVLETWFSIDSQAKIVNNVTILRADQANSTSSDFFDCNNGFGGSSNNELRVKPQLRHDNGRTSVVLFFESTRNLFYYHQISLEVQFRLCEQAGTCNDSWNTLPVQRPMPGIDSSRLALDLPKLKAWIPYIVQYRFAVRCRDQSAFVVDSSPLHHRAMFSPIRSLEVPAVVGPVKPVTDIHATASVVSWNYSRSYAAPSYFLVTHCTNSECASQSVSGNDRSLNLGTLKERSVTYVTIQAVQLRDDQAYVSPTEIASIILPQSRSVE